MNARQKAKKYKNKIKALESDNKLMREIIADSPAMQELYNAYNKPNFVTQTTMQFQEYRSKCVLSPDENLYDVTILNRAKRELANNLVEGIKEYITYEINDKETPTITASIFVGKR